MAEQPRLWGWDDWIEEWWVPLHPTVGEGPSPRLWIVEGRPERGGRDLLSALESGSRDPGNSGDVEQGLLWLERQPSESDSRWQLRAARGWEGTAAQGGLSLLVSGDALPQSWWTRQFGRWVEHGAGGRLVVLAEAQAQAIAAIARRVGGPQGESVRCPVPRWSKEKVHRWRETFAAHLPTSTEALIEASNGGWPGYLWNFLEGSERQGETEESQSPWLTRLLAMDRVAARWLLAAAEAPAPHRDWIEMLTGSEIPLVRWQETRLGWIEAGWLTEGHAWVDSVVEQIRGAATRWPEAPAPSFYDRRDVLKRIYALLPQEGSRRLLRPLSRLPHFDPAFLGEVFGEDGREMVAVLEEHPMVCPKGSGPWRLDAGFSRDWTFYDRWMPSEVGDEWMERAREAWARRRVELNKARAEAEATLAQETQRLDLLQRSLLASRAAEALPGASRKHGGPPPTLRGRLWRAHGLVVLGMTWLYLDSTGEDPLSGWRILGAIACLFAGGLSMLRAEGNRNAARVPARHGHVDSEAARAAARLARDRSDRQSAQVSRARERFQAIESSLGKPFVPEAAAETSSAVS